MMRLCKRDFALIGAILCLNVGSAGLAEDSARKICLPDAKRLCPAQVKALDRKAVEACMIGHIAETSPQCHEKMLTIRDQRAKRGKAT